MRSLDEASPAIIDLTLLYRKIMVSNRDAILWPAAVERRDVAGVSTARCLGAVRIANDSTRATSSSSSPTTAGSTLLGRYTKPIEELKDIDSTFWW